MVVGEELGKTASLDLFLEEVKLVKKHDKGLPLEVDVVHDGGKQVQTLVHPVGLIVLVKKLKIKVESEVASRHHEVPRRDADFVCRMHGWSPTSEATARHYRVGHKSVS